MTARVTANEKVEVYDHRRLKKASCSGNMNLGARFAAFELDKFPATPSPNTKANLSTTLATMASKKDMRRVDLVIPYVEPPAEKDNDFSSTFSSTMPMAAVRSSLQGSGSVILITV